MRQRHNSGGFRAGGGVFLPVQTVPVVVFVAVGDVGVIADASVVVTVVAASTAAVAVVVTTVIVCVVVVIVTAACYQQLLYHCNQRPLYLPPPYRHDTAVFPRGEAFQLSLSHHHTDISRLSVNGRGVDSAGFRRMQGSRMGRLMFQAGVAQKSPEISARRKILGFKKKSQLAEMKWDPAPCPNLMSDTLLLYFFLAFPPQKKPEKKNNKIPPRLIR